MKEIILDKIHSTKIKKLEPDESLGVDIISLRYDLIIPIIKGMKKQTKKEEVGDRKRKRIKLANELKNLYDSLSLVENSIKNISKICNVYHKEEKKIQKIKNKK